MHVIGTAGHVDHGKSSLVRALTGIDPDRLKEEKEREMTIDLGFAWMKSSDGLEEIGIVDVPGHRDFIENMLAGVGGIDLALLVIAADEGVMPQTLEHLAILDLLEVSTGIIALTKIDLIDDEDWLELVTLDVSESLSGTRLAEAPIVPVSTVTGEGMDQVRMAIYHGLESTGSKNSHSIPRLPIDRVFTLAGFGTVVTGTLLGGQLYSGLNIVIEPGGYAGRIRGLQTHKTKIETAVPGSRVAVNLTGLDKEDIKRGDVLTLPGSIPSTLLCDVSYRHLPKALEPLLHNQEVKFFSGAAEVIARSRVIGAKKINPGEDGWLQLAFQDSVALIRGDHFILRRPSPAATIGGGVILDPHPGRRHRRFKPDVHARFKTLSLGNPAELLMETLRRYEPMAAASLIHRSGLDASDGDSLVHQQLEAGEIIKISQHFYSRSGWQMILGRATSIISTFHEHWPLRIGIPREELRSRLGLENTHFNIMLGEMSENGTVAVKDGKVKLASHEIKLTSNERAKADKVLGSFAKAGVNSPNVKDAKSEAGEDVYNALLELGELVQISSDVVYRTSEYEQIIQLILESLQEKNRLNAAEVRDILGTSRKYAIALLEHLDDIKVTKREGDHRKLIVNVSPARQQKS